MTNLGYYFRLSLSLSDNFSLGEKTLECIIIATFFYFRFLKLQIETHIEGFVDFNLLL